VADANVLERLGANHAAQEKNKQQSYGEFFKEHVEQHYSPAAHAAYNAEVKLSQKIQFEQWVPVEIGKVFLFFANPRNLPRIMPPATETKLIEVKLVSPPDAVAKHGTELAGVGSEIVTSFRLFRFLPIHAKWTARIAEFEWNHHFADSQIKGPFKRFYHRHELNSETRTGVEGTVVKDVIEYDVGYGLIGRIAEKFIAGQMRQTFEYRQQALEKLLGV
jgi:ligand-binding SRPBCC domain-containing protein